VDLWITVNFNKKPLNLKQKRAILLKIIV